MRSLFQIQRQGKMKDLRGGVKRLQDCRLRRSRRRWRCPGPLLACQLSRSGQENVAGVFACPVGAGDVTIDTSFEQALSSPLYALTVK
jgi:hypothetical protein